MRICRMSRHQVADMTRSPGPQIRRADAGVTLVEILVVLSIIAITTGAAMLRLGIGRGSYDLATAAGQLALSVTEASDASLASGQDRLLELAPEAYRIGFGGSLADSGWRRMPGLSLANVTGDARVLRLSATGASAPFRLRLSADGRSVVVRFDGLQARVEGAP